MGTYNLEIKRYDYLCTKPDFFVGIANTMRNEANQTRKQKSTDRSLQENHHKNKYTRTDNSTRARKAYSRHDNSTCPEEVAVDVPPHYLEELKEGFYATKVIASSPGPLRGGGERAWYTLFAHAQLP